MIDYALILEKKFPDMRWSLNANDYPAQLQWFSDEPAPSKEELDSLWDEVQSMVQAELDAKAAAKESALTKLQALGLSEAEAKQIVGI
jgi:hypothetical protein